MYYFLNTEFERCFIIEIETQIINLGMGLGRAKNKKDNSETFYISN